MQSEPKLKILFVSAEVSPFAKTGGLADVAGSLPKALAQMGNDVRIVMPRYRDIVSSMKYVTDFSVHMDNNAKTCIIRETEITAGTAEGRMNIPVYFIDSYDYYDRDGIYCHPDDGERFAFFCNSTIEMLPKINFQPDIIHCNDWHTGPICMLLKEKYIKHNFYKGISTLYTIHNLEYQGNFPEEILKLFNIGYEIFVPDKVEFYGMFNFMKAGLVYADIINTVSETYSKEIQTQQYGEGLDGLLIARDADLFGIVNGISYEEFDPSTDKRIYRNYDSMLVENKKENKYALQKETGLPVGDMPVIGLISRLSGQKGLELIIDRIDEIMKHNLQFILLGTGDPYYESSFLKIKNKYMDKMAVYIEFNAVLAQRIYAGSDMFLMPSRFEPCGLGQIISLRYGTIPIVRATGGLSETITDYYRDKDRGNGFSFDEFSSDEFLKTMEGALMLYNQRPEEWRKLVKRALEQDFSWRRSAEKYVKLYNAAIKRKKYPIGIKQIIKPL
ncbi:MAG TPA: glycogen synthase GlgA [Clostridiales bacterium]|nr:glycogen synthase GlgA [Clostridiales bacterium]